MSARAWITAGILALSLAACGPSLDDNLSPDWIEQPTP